MPRRAYTLQVSLFNVVLRVKISTRECGCRLRLQTEHNCLCSAHLSMLYACLCNFFAEGTDGITWPRTKRKNQVCGCVLHCLACVSTYERLSMSRQYNARSSVQAYLCSICRLHLTDCRLSNSVLLLCGCMLSDCVAPPCWMYPACLVLPFSVVACKFCACVHL